MTFIVLIICNTCGYCGYCCCANSSTRYGNFLHIFQSICNECSIWNVIHFACTQRKIRNSLCAQCEWVIDDWNWAVRRLLAVIQCKWHFKCSLTNIVITVIECHISLLLANKLCSMIIISASLWRHLLFRLLVVTSHIFGCSKTFNMMCLWLFITKKL